MEYGYAFMLPHIFTEGNNFYDQLFVLFASIAFKRKAMPLWKEGPVFRQD